MLKTFIVEGENYCAIVRAEDVKEAAMLCAANGHTSYSSITGQQIPDEEINVPIVVGEIYK